MSNNKKIITISSLAICFILIFIYVLSPLHIGINNGEINANVEQSVGLSGVSDGSFYIKYNINDNSPEISKNGSYGRFTKMIVNIVRHFTDFFDIRILSFILSIFLLISVFYINKYIDLKTNMGNILLAVLTIFIFFDMSYLVYLNTLYAEGTFYVTFIFIVSLYIKLICSKKPQIPTMIIYYLSVLFLCGLKPHLWLIAVPFVAMGLYLFVRRKGYTFRALLIIMSVITFIYPMFGYDNFTDENRDVFNSTFYGVLYEDNENTGKEKLALNDNLDKYIGKSSFDKNVDLNSDDLKTYFYNNISYKDITKAYLSKLYIEKYKYVGFNAFETYPKYQGNFTSDSGKPSDARAGGFNIFNIIKSKLFPKTLWFIYGLPILLIILLIGYRKKINNGFVALGSCVSVSSIILFNIPMINSGLFDISRTMAIFNIAFDSVLMMLIILLIYVTSIKRLEFKEKYGLSQ